MRPYDKEKKSAIGMGMEVEDTVLYKLHYAYDQVVVIAQDKDDLEYISHRSME